MADKRNPFTPFDFSNDGLTEMMKNLQMPGFNPQALLQSQRRNMEALTRASQISAQGLSGASQRQAEFLQQAMGELAATTQKLSQAKTTGDMLTQQGEVVSDIFERTLNSMRELADIVEESNAEAFDVISRRVEENIEELQNLADPSQAKQS